VTRIAHVIRIIFGVWHDSFLSVPRFICCNMTMSRDSQHFLKCLPRKLCHSHVWHDVFAWTWPICWCAMTSSHNSHHFLSVFSRHSFLCVPRFIWWDVTSSLNLHHFLRWLPYRLESFMCRWGLAHIEMSRVTHTNESWMGHGSLLRWSLIDLSHSYVNEAWHT